MLPLGDVEKSAYWQFKVPELRQELVRRSVDCTGCKEDLVLRLMSIDEDCDAADIDPYSVDIDPYGGGETTIEEEDRFEEEVEEEEEEEEGEADEVVEPEDNIEDEPPATVFERETVNEADEAQAGIIEDHLEEVAIADGVGDAEEADGAEEVAGDDHGGEGEPEESNGTPVGDNNEAAPMIIEIDSEDEPDHQARNEASLPELPKHAAVPQAPRRPPPRPPPPSHFPSLPKNGMGPPLKKVPCFLPPVVGRDGDAALPSSTSLPQACFDELPPPAASLSLHARQLRALLVDGVCSDQGMEYPGLIGRLRSCVSFPSTSESSDALVDSNGEVAAAAATTSSRNGEASASRRAECCLENHSTPDAVLALLQTYAADEKWCSFSNGYVIFEDDDIQYPSTTLMPVREQPRDSPSLNLGSLWLLLALGPRYETAATPELLGKYDATRVSSEHAARLLRYLKREEKMCDLLMPKAEVERLPLPLPKACHERKDEGAGKNPAVADSRPPPPHLASASSESRAVAPPPPASVPRLMAERLERLRQDIVRKRVSDASATPSATEDDDTGASEPNGTATSKKVEEISRLRQAVFEKLRLAGEAEVAARHLEDREKLLARALEAIDDSLAATSRQYESAKTRKRKLEAEFVELRKIREVDNGSKPRIALEESMTWNQE